jgi:hypothetical protein
LPHQAAFYQPVFLQSGKMAADCHGRNPEFFAKIGNSHLTAALQIEKHSLMSVFWAFVKWRIDHLNAISDLFRLINATLSCFTPGGLGEETNLKHMRWLG